MILIERAGYLITATNTDRYSAVAYITPSGRLFTEQEKIWLRDNLNITFEQNGVLGIDSGRLSDPPERAKGNLDMVSGMMVAAAFEMEKYFA